MKALKTVALGRAEVVDGVPIPSITSFPGHVLVKVKYAGVNHCDWVFTDYEMVFHKDITIGGEFSGEVVEAGKDCTRFRKGNKIAGCVFPSGSAMPNAGVEAEYALVRGDAMFDVDAIGDKIGMDQAAGLGIAFSTVFYGLYYDMKLRLPGASGHEITDEPASEDTIFIYGGTTNTGVIAIQYAKLSGYRIITVCSPNNFEYVRSLGADEVFDYHDAVKCIDEIRASVCDGLKLVFDTVGTFESPRICAGVIAEGGMYESVSPWPFPRADVRTRFVQGNKVLGDSFQFGGQTIPAELKAFSEWKGFVKMSEQLIRDGKIKLPKLQIIKGLESIPGALEDHRKWTLSATKLVCEI